MIRVKKIALALTLALTMAAGATAQVAGDPSQWGVAKKGSFDITEELLASGDNDNNGDVPVVPGVASFSWGSTNQTSFIDDEEVIEQVAGSNAEKSFGRESS